MSRRNHGPAETGLAQANGMPIDRGWVVTEPLTYWCVDQCEHEESWNRERMEMYQQLVGKIWYIMVEIN